jgi:hypothetical protein
MPKFVSQNAMIAELAYIRDTADNMHVITAYTQGDTYATVVANSVCTIAVTATDLPVSVFGTLDEQITVASKTGTASASSPPTPDLHLAIVDSVGAEVLAVGDETTDQDIVSGNPITTPIWYIRTTQPV